MPKCLKPLLHLLSIRSTRRGNRRVTTRPAKTRDRLSRLAAALGLAAGLLAAQSVRAEDSRAPEHVAFYFAAHEDDWQLFMNPSAFADTSEAKTKTVFIHLTAGDAGVGMGTRGRKHPYYLARENGAEVAIRFMADSGEQPTDKVASQIRLNGHPIYRVSYRNTATYFLRLPDGHPAGTGFPGTGYQSLERLAKGAIGDFSAIDGSTAYHGWADLVSTLRAIIDHERGGTRSIALNVAEPDTRINPDDHSDHRFTAQAALEAAKDLSCVRRVYYVEYASRVLPENLAGQQRDMESSVLAVTAAGLLALDHASVWHPYHRSYLGRNYFRVEEGTGRCDAPVADALRTVSAAGAPATR
jgi:hypothetical protein